jgi:hypothetical protein
MSAASAALNEALTDYESNGIRYEPKDREELMNLMIQVDHLRRRLTLFLSEVPFQDHHPIGETVVESAPRSIQELFEELEDSKFISPEGPLEHHVGYQQLKEVFQNTSLTLLEAFHLLHKVRSA